MTEINFFVHLDAQNKKIKTNCVSNTNAMIYDTLRITLDVSENGTQPFYNTVCVPFNPEALKKAIGLLKIRMDNEEYKFPKGAFLAISHDIIEKSKESLEYQEFLKYTA